jgi:hypothetical protein
LNKVLIFAAIALARSAWAGVTVVHDPSTNTFWPFGPMVEAVTNPAMQAVVAESFNTSPVVISNLAQTFIVNGTNQGLRTIAIYAMGGSGTGTGTNLTLNLYDLGFQSPPNPSIYSDFTMISNLLGNGAGLPINYSPQAQPGFVDFIFTEFVPLQFGHMYAFELAGTPGTAPLYWMRTGGGNAFQGGTAYGNRTWLDNAPDIDFALAVHTYDVAATNPPPPTPGPTSSSTIYLTVNLGSSSAVAAGGGLRIGSIGAFNQVTAVTFILAGPGNPNPIPLEFACIADQGYHSPPPSHLVPIQDADWHQVGDGGYYEKTVTFNYLPTPSAPSLVMSLLGATLFGQVNYTYEVDQSSDLLKWTPAVASLPPSGMTTLSSPSMLIPGTAPMQNGFLYYRAESVACP